MKELSIAHVLHATPEVAPGYKFDKAADLTIAAERERLSPTAIRAFVNICDKWGLNEVQARALLGGIASSTFHAWKANPDAQKLSQDTLVRISLVIGIYKALHIYFSKVWADRWVRLGNRGALFAGRAPIDFMIRQGQPGMLEVRRMLDAWRGGR
jgi:antitoxin Xre/MbcA/ParS-like protein